MLFPLERMKVVLVFNDVRRELVECSLCVDYRPPEIHLAPAFDHSDLEDV